MKKLCIYLFLVLFSFQTPSQADDIRDFQIEGMSIGDSLLDFFSKKQINTFVNYDDLPSDMKFRIIEFSSNEPLKMKIYDGMQLFYKPSDKKYIIHNVSGFIDCSNKTNCNKIFNEIEQDLDIVFKKTKPDKRNFKHIDDKSGKSIVRTSNYKLNDGSIAIKYTNWSSIMSYAHAVRVSANTNETNNWMSSNYGVD